MKKRILSIFLCVCMMLSLLPTTALATSWNGVAASGIGFNYTGSEGAAFIDITMPTTESYYTYGTCTTSDGTTTAAQIASDQATLPASNWNWAVQKKSYTDSHNKTYNYTVTLKGFNLNYSGGNDAFMFKTSIKLMLEGENTISAPSAGTGLSGNTSCYLYIDGTGTLNVTATNGINLANTYLTIASGVINTINNTNCGIRTSAVYITGGTVTTSDGNLALLNAPDYSSYTGSHVAIASTSIDGSDAAAYNSEDNSSYHYFYIGPIMSVDLNGDGTFENSYADFAEGWNAAIGSNNTANTTVKLLANWTATDGSFGTGVGFGIGVSNGTGNIYVPSGKTITLDLNGKTIDRALSSATSNGYVILNYGTLLTICDISTTTVADQDKITGGYNIRFTGGVTAWSSGAELCFYGGEISGNYCGGSTTKQAGGESVTTKSSNGQLPITVGGTVKITGNYSGTSFDNNLNVEKAGSINNVYLSEWTNSLGNTNQQIITCDPTTRLASGASIGVTTSSAPTSSRPIFVTGANSADYSNYFTSDNSAYTIYNNGTDSTQIVKLKLTPAETPSITSNLSTTEVSYIRRTQTRRR